jgi:hypothetical protein
MSVLQEGDASEFEGAFKKKEVTASRHKKDVIEEKEPVVVSTFSHHPTRQHRTTSHAPYPRAHIHAVHHNTSRHITQHITQHTTGGPLLASPVIIGFYRVQPSVMGQMGEMGEMVP